MNRYVIWLHDYGSQFGFRLALSAPDHVAGLIIQNGDIYEDAFGPKYDFLKESWEHPGPAARRKIAEHVTAAGFESEFRGELPDDVADRISPDLWTLHWSLMSTPARIANLATYPTSRSTCSAAGTGCWRPTWTRSCRWSMGSWHGSTRRARPGQNGAAQGNRTPDLLITSEMLYRLS